MFKYLCISGIEAGIQLCLSYPNEQMTAVLNWCSVTDVMLREREANALDYGWRIGIVCCGVSGRVVADINKWLQREQTILVSPLLISGVFSLRKLHTACCPFFYSCSRLESMKRQ